MDTSYTIDPMAEETASVKTPEVLLTFTHICGHKKQYLFSSEKIAKEAVSKYQALECDECAGNTAYAKRFGGYLGKTK